MPYEINPNLSHWSYQIESGQACEFINDREIVDSLNEAELEKNNLERALALLERARDCRGLSHREAAFLLAVEDPRVQAKIEEVAIAIKEKLYGRRIVLFAPLYLSNYCINSCVYCPYHVQNRQMPRLKLSQEELRQELRALQDMGHKRLALECGEDPVHNSMEYILDCIQTIYAEHHRNGAIRRVNVNIAATTVDNYRRLSEAGIGTYILFQETYNKAAYEALHPAGPKSDYAYHTEAMDRAMDGGIDDVGIGVLFGLEHYRYDFVGLLMHAEHLERAKGVGPHTISVPRICPADDVDSKSFSHAIDDETFARLVALIRIAVPYTGMIISTRESAASRARALRLGISQISGGSLTTVGGYAAATAEGIPAHEEGQHSSAQFETSDRRSLDEIISWLLELGYIPSFCTACYREGRTGDRFMALCKSGQIVNCCQPNALLTLQEYLLDYGSPRSRELGKALIERELEHVENPAVKAKTIRLLQEMVRSGQRDFRF